MMMMTMMMMTTMMMKTVSLGSRGTEYSNNFGPSILFDAFFINWPRKE
jgi:hypothetical protein